MQTESLVQPTTAVSPEVSQMLLEWQKAKIALDAAKEHEMELRKRIVFASGLFDATKDKGTQRVELGHGWQVKAEKKLNWKVDNKEGQAFVALAQLAELGEGAARVAQTLFSFTANIKTSEYAKLTADEKRVIEPILTIESASPSLELVPPKA